MVTLSLPRPGGNGLLILMAVDVASAPVASAPPGRFTKTAIAIAAARACRTVGPAGEGERTFRLGVLRKLVKVKVKKLS
jgi:hypothetical protein